MKILEFLSYLRSKDIRLWVDGEQQRCSPPKGLLTPVLKKELSNHNSEIINLLRQFDVRVNSAFLPLQPMSRDSENEIDSFSRRYQRLLFKYFSSFALNAVKPLFPTEDNNYWRADSTVVVKAIK